MYLRAPGMDSSVARRRETGSGGRSLGLMAERPLKGNMEERPDMGVDKWRPTLERRRVAYRMEWLLSQALNNRLNHEGAQALSLSLSIGSIVPVRSSHSIPTVSTTMSVAASPAAAGPSNTPSLATLADSQPRLMDAAAMEYFLLEAVQTLRHSSAVADARAQKIEDEMIEAGLIPPPPPPQVRAKKDVQRDSVTSAASDDEEDGLRARLEAIGFHVGANITERCASHIVFKSNTYRHSKTMPWPGWFHRYPGHHKICMQRAMVNVLGQAS